MDATFLKDWLGVAALLISVGGAFYAWVAASGNKALKAVDDMKREALAEDKRVSEHMGALEKRVSAIESELKHLPTKEDLDDLKDRLADLSKEVAVSNKSMEAMQNVIKRVDDFVMRAGK